LCRRCLRHVEEEIPASVDYAGRIEIQAKDGDVGLSAQHSGSRRRMSRPW
jgi:hypothetical protein